MMEKGYNRIQEPLWLRLERLYDYRLLILISLLARTFQQWSTHRMGVDNQVVTVYYLLYSSPF